MLRPLLAVLLAGPAAAAPMTWEDCVSLARRQNPELASARHTAAADRYSTLGSYNGFLPHLSASNSYSDSRGASGDSRWQTSASASLALFDPARAADIRSASASAARSEAALRQASVSLRFELRQAFARLLLAQEGVRVSEAVRDIRDHGARMVSLRYQSGRESKGNMLRTDAERLRAEADLAQALRGLRTARMSLARGLGLDGYEALTATGDFSTAGAPPADMDLSPRAAERPDVAAADAAARSAEAGLARSRSVLWPTLSTSYARSWAERAEFPSARPGWTFGGVLSLPLLSGGPTAAYAAVSASRESLATSRESARAARARALDDLESARAGFAGALDQARVQAALLEASRQRNDEADIRYASGLLAFDNWELIVTDRVGSERQALQARFDAVVAEAAWSRAVGTPLGE